MDNWDFSIQWSVDHPIFLGINNESVTGQNSTQRRIRFLSLCECYFFFHIF